MTDSQEGLQISPEAIEEQNKTAIGRIRNLIWEMKARQQSEPATVGEGAPGDAPHEG